MKITRFDVTPLTNRGLLLQVETDAGLTGLGAPMNYEHGRTVERAILDMGDYLIGRDPAANRRPLADPLPLQLFPPDADPVGGPQRHRNGLPRSVG